MRWLVVVVWIVCFRVVEMEGCEVENGWREKGYSCMQRW